MPLKLMGGSERCTYREKEKQKKIKRKFDKERQGEKENLRKQMNVCAFNSY
jgi:hypothetical protein